ncbi:DMT family transporter [Chitinophaga polysaccharea]|uniref:DMT family transporter n=1 Tax=Chitinophaga TaxID=79328 RepID=UPI0014559C43|nr:MULTISPECIES: DMT family transporter [Chitinophaga]NLR58203.1 DMT family transporter [Chitinophaga polysaccharea]NLU90727.1 DMT family transporter [Chitinophaga sp. Ak27]
MEKKYLFLVLLIIGTAFWGISFPVTKMATDAVSPSTFLFYRFLAATIVLAAVLRKQLKRMDRPALTAGMALAIPLTFGIHFQTLGIKYTPASQCAFVAGICVVMIPVIKQLVYKTRVDLKIWVAAITALVGLFIISVRGNLVIGRGDVYTIIGSFGFAIYLIQVERYSTGRDILPTIIPMFATCALIMLCIATGDKTANWLPVNQGFWMGIGYCALFSTAYMYTISNLSQRYISAEKVAIIYLFEPIFAAIAAILMLGEQLSWQLLAGGALIFAGTLMSEANFKRKGAYKDIH